MSSAYKKIIDEINSLGGDTRGSGSPYVILHCLAKLKGKDIYDSPSKIRKAHGHSIPLKKLDRLVKEALDQYLKSGLLVIPSYFKPPAGVSAATSNVQSLGIRKVVAPIEEEAELQEGGASNIYQPIIDEVNSLGGRATGGETLYVLLHRLAKVKGQDMNGSAAMVGREFGLKRPKINKLAKDALREYLNSGHLIIPSYFKFRESRQYKHDGDGEANRNLWKGNRKIYTEIPEGSPLPDYTLNTTKK